MSRVGRAGLTPCTWIRLTYSYVTVTKYNLLRACTVSADYYSRNAVRLHATRVKEIVTNNGGIGYYMEGKVKQFVIGGKYRVAEAYT